MKLTMDTVNRYLSMCEHHKRLDRKTIKAYRIDLRQFTEYLTAAESDFTRDALKSYLSEMNQIYKPRTVKRKLASIRALVSWLLDEELLDRNPFENLHAKAREPAFLPRIIPLRVLCSMLAAAHQRLVSRPEDHVALTEAAVLELLFATGIRVSELSGLKTWQIDLVDGTIRIFGKGKKERILYITNAEVLAILRQHANIIQPEPDGYFFRNRRGARLSEQSVRALVRKYGEMVDYPLRITPHMFRHTVATQLLDGGADIRCIQQILGHASILTTQIYTHVAGEKQREVMIHNHPRNNFKFSAGIV